jgi:hypothetical protein
MNSPPVSALALPTEVARRSRPEGSPLACDLAGRHQLLEEAQVLLHLLPRLFAEELGRFRADHAARRGVGISKLASANAQLCLIPLSLARWAMIVPDGI